MLGKSFEINFQLLGFFFFLVMELFVNYRVVLNTQDKDDVINITYHLTIQRLLL